MQVESVIVELAILRRVRRPPCLSQVNQNSWPGSARISDCELVFPDTQGGFLRASDFSRQVWHPLRAAAGIPETVTFHDLRHTCASLLLGENIHPKVVAERLGHSDVTLTLNTYSHLLPRLQADAARRIDDLFSSIGHKRGTNPTAAMSASVAKPL